MKSCFEMTGGHYVLSDSFGNPVFKESFKKFFEPDDNNDLKMGFLANTKLLVSKEFKISGLIGQAAPIKTKENAAYASTTEIGTGGTNQWYLGSLDYTKTLAVYFDIIQTENKTSRSNVYLQF